MARSFSSDHSTRKLESPVINRDLVGKDESLTPVERSPFWRMGVLSVFISKLLCKTNLAGGAPFENYSTHFFRLNGIEALYFTLETWVKVKHHGYLNNYPSRWKRRRTTGSQQRHQV